MPQHLHLGNENDQIPHEVGDDRDEHQGCKPVSWPEADHRDDESGRHRRSSERLEGNDGANGMLRA